MKKIMLMAFAMLAVPTLSLAQKTTVTTMNKSLRYHKESHTVSMWYEGELNAGYGFGGTCRYDDAVFDANYWRPFIETVHGVRIKQYAFVGAGLGVQYAFKKDYWNTLMMPIFLNVKGLYPVTDDFAPYFSMDLGGSVCLLADDFNDDETRYRGGFYGSFGLGLNYKRLNFGFGWQIQKSKFKDLYDDEYLDRLRVSSFFVKIGLKFL